MEYLPDAELIGWFTTLYFTGYLIGWKIGSVQKLVRQAIS